MFYMSAIQTIDYCTRVADMLNMSAIQTLDYLTHIALHAIWKEPVKECIANDIETGIIEDWDFVEYTPFTEPFFVVVVNK